MLHSDDKGSEDKNEDLASEQKKQKLAEIEHKEAALSIAGNTLFTGIFAFFTKEALQAFFAKIGNYIFPIALFLNIWTTYLAWKKAYYDDHPRHLVTAVVLSLSSVAIATVIIGGIVAAAIGSLVATVLFATLAPFVFTIVSAVATV